jgi:hypothetical protein
MADKLSVDDQINNIMEGIYSGNWGISRFSTWAEVDGLGLVIDNVIAHEVPRIRFLIKLAQGVPFSRELCQSLSEYNKRISFGAVNMYEEDGGTVTLRLFYNVMLPWIEDATPNSLGVAQSLLDIIGNLPPIARQISDEVLSTFGGEQPELDEGWDLGHLYTALP